MHVNIPFCGAVLSASLLTACASPATDVAVPTISMHDALELSHGVPPGPPERPTLPRRMEGPPPATAAPRAVITTPDIRLAYIYEWVDNDGNKHFGEWVAIPVSGFRWIMDDGGPSIPGAGAR